MHINTHYDSPDMYFKEQTKYEGGGSERERRVRRMRDTG